MRVVHIFQRDDPATGGALRVAEALVQEQSASGVDARLIFLYGPPATVSSKFRSDQVICLGLSSSREAARGIPALRKAIRMVAPDIIHSHDGIVWPRLALLGIGIPIVMHAHLPAWDPHSVKERIGWALISKTTDFLIGISHHTIETWKQAGFPGAKIRYVPNGVDFKRFHMIADEEKAGLRRALGLPESKRILLWIGQMHRSMKGTDRMEHVAARLPEDTVMLAVGNGPEFEGIQVRCKSLLDAGRLIMTGTVPDPETYFMVSDAFMFTSYHEPFGLVILEAVASGLPVMAFPLTQGGGASALFDEFRAVMVDDNVNAENVAAALKDLADRKQEAPALRERAMTGYDWRISSAQVVDAYRSLLGCQPLRVLVCQHGSRHRYALPRMLDSAGALAAFYTDTSSESFFGKTVKFLGAFGVARFRKTLRYIDGVSPEKICSSDCSRIPELIQRLTGSGKSGIELFRQRHRYLSEKMKKWGLRNANMVYSMYYENLDFIRWAKQQGATCAVDVYVSPLTDEIMIREFEDFQDWGGKPDENDCELRKKLWIEASKMADILTCPSEWVAEGVRATAPWAADKIRVVPYGCSMNYEGLVNRPVRGRVLFAGRDPFRKGLHYLAQAASMLKEQMPEIDVRVAGAMPDHVIKHPVCRDLHFLGQLDSSEMKKEFLEADVFVLPGLSEGFASVIAESIGAGCPVVVTRESGSPIVHEREGLLIPSRDGKALADAVRRMVSDREFRDQCAKNCQEQVPFYSEKQWESRLLKALSDGLKS
ncbi:MAG: glycosyltransferase family 4 protein [Pontiellaceae bacterium]|nr:glycosyltransferase family 4 protein [Pontiellaceae bacterium]MBN2783913.1 glycosyltransferase family 4 protein [Pontiellaceae bacterium]